MTHIPKRTRLIEYTGERISHEEADRRYADEHEYSPHTMLFTVNDDTVIDATRHGSSARWFNHSCSPNCEVEDEADRIYIHTRRDVRPGEELTYDYLQETDVDWYNDEGGFGKLVIDVQEGTVTLEVNQRYTDSTCEFQAEREILTGEDV